MSGLARHLRRSAIMGFGVMALAACTTDSGIGEASPTFQEREPWSTMSSSTAFPCDSESNAGRTAIEDYVGAWNDGDAESLAGMLTGTYETDMACKFDAAIATGYTLDADWDACRLNVRDETAEVDSWSMDVWLFDLSTSYSGDGILSASEIPRDLVASYVGDDAEVLSYWSCTACSDPADVYTADQMAVIDAYVEAFNARDRQAIADLFAYGTGTRDPVKEYQALFASGLTLAVDLDAGTYTLYDDGEALNPGPGGPCLLQWFPFFEFAMGSDELLQSTQLAMHLWDLDEAQHLLDPATRELVDEALGL